MYVALKHSTFYQCCRLRYLKTSAENGHFLQVQNIMVNKGCSGPLLPDVKYWNSDAIKAESDYYFMKWKKTEETKNLWET